jgi:cellulose synthase/poly-beta-1,6-N-acetylglucosamine synthase-like glycosyltransferase
MFAYRLLEILPGALTWLTIILMFVLSWLMPAGVAIFIILFDLYWLLKTFYMFAHLKSTYAIMNENLKIDWLQKLEADMRGLDGTRSGYARDSNNIDWGDIYHLVVLPMYKEPYEVVRETLESLSKVNYPKEKMIVVLSHEERAGDESTLTAEKIGNEFKDIFFKFLVTKHPSNLTGEIPGKGSNETWAAREAKKLILDENGIKYDKVITSVFDIDTQIPENYFARLTYMFMTVPDPFHAIYQPIPFFVNNIYEASALSRVMSFSATFWQMMQQSRPERLTSFSSQSISFKALHDIDFWETNVVAEDSRIFWQSYLHYNGKFRVEPLLFPVYMDANVASTFWVTLKNLYKQQRRWAWGVEDVPYLLSGFRKNPRIPFKKKIYWGFHIIEGFHSWATNSIMIFALGWLPILLGGRAFNYTLLSYSLPQVTSFIVNLSMFGVATSSLLGIILLPPKPTWFSKRHYLLYAVQWLLVPITLIVFGSIPAIDAQTRLMLGGRFRLGFWVTPKSRSEKARIDTPTHAKG